MSTQARNAPDGALAILDWQGLDSGQRRAALARPPQGVSDERRRETARIIASVRAGGDAALAELTERLDGVRPAALRVPADAFDAAEASLTEVQRAAIRRAIDTVTTFHEAQRYEPPVVQTAPGVRCSTVIRAIGRVGLYVPAGSAPLPSAVIMLAVPARIADCERRIICSPPGADGLPDPSVLVAARYCGVEEVYAVGGAQAVAAMAYGTESIPSCDKIFGPGNAWVTEAKLQVSLDPDGAALDLPAGPSEVLVIADDSADPSAVAADLLSQAEHGPDSQVLLVTPSRGLADTVAEEVDFQLASLPRRDIAAQAIANSRMLVVDSLEQALVVSNSYGPEHLILAVDDARRWTGSIRVAGSVFLGHYAPESLGDYCSGTNHVLPTYGYAKAWSGLGLADFQRRISVQEVTLQGLEELGPTAVTLARLEGLEAHARAVIVRIGEGDAES